MTLTPELIPAISIAIIYLYDGWLWLELRLRRIHVAWRYYSIFALCFLLQGLLYLFFYFIDVPVELRGFWARVSLLSIAFSFGIPLTFQRFRG